MSVLRVSALSPALSCSPLLSPAPLLPSSLTLSSMSGPIYLDHQATTPVDTRVLDAMLPFFSETFGNAASGSHPYGWAARAAVKRAREECAAILGAEPIDIVFTSGSTEGLNLALKGAATAYGRPGGHLVTAATEHPAVLDTARWLEAQGFRLTVLPVDRDGRIDLAELAAALADDTFAVALMAANNEIGTLHPIREIGALCRERGVLFVCDATQGVGKIPIDVTRDPVDVLSWSAHKMYGPKGAGALYVRNSDPHVRLDPLLHGGGHERGMRSGTLNVPGIVGLGAACRLAREELDEEAARLTRLRDRLWEGLSSGLDGVTRNGPATDRLPGNLNVSIAWCDGESLMLDLRDVVAVSSGSACHSTNLEPSHVLTAIGVEDLKNAAAIRFGLGRTTTEEQIDRVVEATVAAVTRLRELSPLYELARRRGEAT